MKTYSYLLSLEAVKSCMSSCSPYHPAAIFSLLDELRLFPRVFVWISAAAVAVVAAVAAFLCLNQQGQGDASQQPLVFFVAVSRCFSYLRLVVRPGLTFP